MLIGMSDRDPGYYTVKELDLDHVPIRGELFVLIKLIESNRKPDRTLAKLWWVLLYGYLKYSLRKNENQMRATFFICENRFFSDFRGFSNFRDFSDFDKNTHF